MLDAQGSFPQAGIQDGTRFISLGDYYSCLEVDPSTEESPLDFRGQYCHVFGSPASSASGEDKNSVDRGLVNPLLPPFAAGKPVMKVRLVFYPESLSSTFTFFWYLLYHLPAHRPDPEPWAVPA